MRIGLADGSPDAIACSMIGLKKACEQTYVCQAPAWPTTGPAVGRIK